MFMLSLCDTNVVVGAGATEARRSTNRNNKQAVFKSCASFFKVTSKINNTQVDNAKDVDVKMTMYNLM